MLRVFRRSIYSKVTLVGRIGQNPEFVPFNHPKEDSKYQGSWKFSMATTKSIKRGDEYETETMWHSVTTLRSLKSVGKGSMVLVEGEFKYWQTEDNSKKGVTVVANTVRVLDGKSIEEVE
ncbi:hypothetical protein HDV01_001050 [Terramyces sp. JEL0728]|nr:hypothetical protein HDV01_001050 [Terramyces sp. JEL0728]